MLKKAEPIPFHKWKEIELEKTNIHYSKNHYYEKYGHYCNKIRSNK